MIALHVTLRTLWWVADWAGAMLPSLMFISLVLYAAWCARWI